MMVRMFGEIGSAGYAAGPGLGGNSWGWKKYHLIFGTTKPTTTEKHRRGYPQ